MNVAGALAHGQADKLIDEYDRIAGDGVEAEGRHPSWPVDRYTDKDAKRESS